MNYYLVTCKDESYEIEADYYICYDGILTFYKIEDNEDVSHTAIFSFKKWRMVEMFLADAEEAE